MAKRQAAVKQKELTKRLSPHKIHHKYADMMSHTLDSSFNIAPRTSMSRTLNHFDKMKQMND